MHSILFKEREHADAQSAAEEERARKAQLASSERGMKLYSNQLALARAQRREEYRREVIGQKVR